MGTDPRVKIVTVLTRSVAEERNLHCSLLLLVISDDQFRQHQFVVTHALPLPGRSKSSVTLVEFVPWEKVCWLIYSGMRLCATHR